MQKSSLIVIMVLVLSLITGCKPSIPKGIISPGDMEDILYDYHVMRTMTDQVPSDKNREYNETMLMQVMLKKHGVTEAEFDSSLVYYFSHVDKFSKIYQEVTKRLNEDAMELGASVGELGKITSYSLTGDTANIWNDATSAFLMPRPGYNRLTFALKADTAFKKGDSFQFSMMASYLYKAGMKDALVHITMRYDNDSLSTHFAHCASSGLTTLRVPANVEQRVKDIRLFIYLAPSNDDETNNLLFLNQLQLIRFHQSKDAKKEEDGVKTVGDSADVIKVSDMPARMRSRAPMPVNNNGRVEKVIDTRH